MNRRSEHSLKIRDTLAMLTPERCTCVGMTCLINNTADAIADGKIDLEAGKGVLAESVDTECPGMVPVEPPPPCPGMPEEKCGHDRGKYFLGEVATRIGNLTVAQTLET